MSAVCRGLALLPGLGVVSASHDQTLRVWTSTGECLATLCSHSAIIYRCCILVMSLPSKAAFRNDLTCGKHSQFCYVYLSREMKQHAALRALFLHACVLCRAAASSTGLIASAAEDNTARLWQADGAALQSIEHPGGLVGSWGLGNSLSL